MSLKKTWINFWMIVVKKKKMAKKIISINKRKASSLSVTHYPHECNDKVYVYMRVVLEWLTCTYSIHRERHTLTEFEIRLWNNSFWTTLTMGSAIKP